MGRRRHDNPQARGHKTPPACAIVAPRPILRVRSRSADFVGVMGVIVGPEWSEILNPPQVLVDAVLSSAMVEGELI